MVEIEFKYDVFISYSSANKDWVRKDLLTALENAGLKACIDFRDFKPGKPSIKNIRDSILASKHVLVIITESYVKSGWTDFEYMLSQEFDPANRNERIVPLLKEKCELPPEIKHLTYVNFFDPDDWDISWKQLFAALGKTDVIVPIKLSPKPSRHIVHREDQWDIIDSEIRKRHSEPNLPRSVISIFGAAGIGKTTFLNETLYPRIKEKYPAIPIARIDFDKEFADQKYDVYLRGNILIDLILELEKASGKSADIGDLRREWEKVSSTTTSRQRLEHTEIDLTTVFLDFISYLSSKRDKHPVILILDTVEQADREVIGWIQEKLQAPTIENGYVLWITASRQPLDCQPFYLRPRYFWLPLEPFKEQQIQVQIPEYPEFANTVKMFSCGLPAAITKLAEVILDLEKEKQKALLLSDLKEKQVIERLILSLEDLLRSYFENLEDHYLSRALEILSPFRLFNVAVVTELLPKWLPEYFKPATTRDNALYEIQKMVQTRFVSWDRSRRGYVLEEPSRQIIAFVLKHKDPENYLAIQKWAADHYLDWAKNVEAKRLDYIVEALYHKLNVLLIEKDANTINKLASLLGIMVETAQDRDELNELKEQLESDHDFNSLLNPNDMERLLLPLKDIN